MLSCLFVSVLCTLFFTQLFVGMQMMKNSHCLQYLISQSENSFFVTTRLSFVLTSDFVPHIPLFCTRKLIQHTRQVLRRDVEGLPLACLSCLPERCDRVRFIAVSTHVLSMCADDDFIYVFQDLILRYEATFHRDLRLKNRTKASDTQHHT